jgi:hypothetical protein
MVMKALAILMLIVSPAWAWTPPEGYESDFAKARECRPVEGRKLWVGGKGYYVQANRFWTSDSGQLDDEAVSVIEFDDNTLEALATFADHCK